MTEATTVLVVGGGRGIGAGLVAALGERGHAVGVVDADHVDLTEPEAVAAALRSSVEAVPPAVVVLAHLDPSSFRVGPVVDLDDEGWDAAAERSLRAAFVALQQVHATVADGTRVVVVLPTIAVNGAAGLVPLCTAVEGTRVMVKAVARRWGARGITVNVVEVALDAFTGAPPGGDGDGPAPTQLGAPALGPGSAADDVAALVEALAGDAGAVVTGALLVADRGLVMLP